MKFIDEVTIEVASGSGGPGCVSFRREIFVPRGGPDGGDGGKGGDVIFRTSTRVHSLLDLKLKTKYQAPSGEPGRNQNRAGADGKDLVIVVPIGTVIKDENGHVLKDLDREQDFLFLPGGMGGRGNPFYKTSVNQAPTVAQKGIPGQSATIRLELKLLADVGIIGFPNAGKSTLISHISAAKPKVADYPFTTLIPNLGVVRYNDESHFVVADMPGLVKGASHGVGLGTRFLRHIERTKCFVHLIDASGMSNRDPIQDFLDINFELQEYDRIHSEDDEFHPLSIRRQIVVLNKADVLSAEAAEDIKRRFQEEVDVDAMVISAATGLGLKELIRKTGEMVFNENKEENQEGRKNQKANTKKSSSKESREKGKDNGKSKKGRDQKVVRSKSKKSKIKKKSDSKKLGKKTIKPQKQSPKKTSSSKARGKK